MGMDQRDNLARTPILYSHSVGRNQRSAVPANLNWDGLKNRPTGVWRGGLPEDTRGFRGHLHQELPSDLLDIPARSRAQDMDEDLDQFAAWRGELDSEERGPDGAVMEQADPAAGNIAGDERHGGVDGLEGGVERLRDHGHAHGEPYGASLVAAVGVGDHPKPTGRFHEFRRRGWDLRTIEDERFRAEVPQLLDIEVGHQLATDFGAAAIADPSAGVALDERLAQWNGQPTLLALIDASADGPRYAG